MSGAVASRTVIAQLVETLRALHLVLVLLWIGTMKFTAYEANAMQNLVASSPLRSWTYGVFGVQALSSLIGITLLAIAGLIAARPFSAWVAALGRALAVGMFLTTLSFVLSTPRRMGSLLKWLPGCIRVARAIFAQGRCALSNRAPLVPRTRETSSNKESIRVFPRNDTVRVDNLPSSL